MNSLLSSHSCLLAGLLVAAACSSTPPASRPAPVPTDVPPAIGPPDGGPTGLEAGGPTTKPSETTCDVATDCVFVDAGCGLTAVVNKASEASVAERLRGASAFRTCLAGQRTPAVSLHCEKNFCTTKAVDSNFADGCTSDDMCTTTGGVCGPDIGVLKTRLDEAVAAIAKEMETIDCGVSAQAPATGARCVNQWCVATFD